MFVFLQKVELGEDAHVGAVCKPFTSAGLGNRKWKYMENKPNRSAAIKSLTPADLLIHFVRH